MSSPPKIVVQFAVKAEQKLWRHHDHNVCRCADVISVLTGMGAEKASQAALEAIEQHKPEVLISAGFCGGLSPALKTGDVVISDRIQNDAGNSIHVEVPKSISHLSSLPNAQLLTADEIVHSPEEKEEIHQRTQCDSVDLESFQIAELCVKNNVRFVPVRVVLDANKYAIQTEVTSISNEFGEPKYWSLLKHLCCRPSLIPRLMTLNRMTNIAGTVLSVTLCNIILSLHNESL